MALAGVVRSDVLGRMSEHHAQLSWSRGDQAFTDNRYSRRHAWTFDGGAVVAGSAAPSVVPVPLSDPAAVDPEEALVAATSSCHLLWFLGIAAKRGFRVDSYADDAVGTLGKDAAGRIAVTRVTLRPRVVFSGDRLPTEEVHRALHHEAHERCFIANSLRSEIVCEPTMSVV